MDQAKRTMVTSTKQLESVGENGEDGCSVLTLLDGCIGQVCDRSEHSAKISEPLEDRLINACYSLCNKGAGETLRQSAT